MAGYVIKDPAKAYAILEAELHKMMQEEGVEQKEEAEERKVKLIEKGDEDHLTTVIKLIEGKMAEFAKVLNDKNMPAPEKNNVLVGILTRIEELVRQYHFFLGEIRRAEEAEKNVEKHRDMTLEQLREEIDKVIQLKYHTP
jgi:predicted HTH domain antitoxin